VLCNLGLVNLALARTETACGQFDRAAVLASEFGDQRLEAECRRDLARALSAAGRFADARAELSVALMLSESLHDGVALALAHCELARAAAGAGDMPEALREVACARSATQGLSSAGRDTVDRAIDDVTQAWSEAARSTPGFTGY
jgi:tetratricopeptide (TPR) repeat protein